jgi:hypothetical protein
VVKLHTFIILLILPVVISGVDDNKTISKSKKTINTAVAETWIANVNPKLQAAYDLYENEQREHARFLKEIASYATLKKKQFNLVAMIHRFDLRGPHFELDKFDEYTKLMRVYENEITIARENYDAAAYVFFFEEFARLSIKRAGIINPTCKIKNCECRNYIK